MSRLTKNKKAVQGKYDVDKHYTIEEASKIVKEISMTGIALKMFLVVTVPVIIGMIIRHFAKNFVDNQASLIQKISVILYFTIIINSNHIPFII